jgi:hypothetical protein
MITPASPCQTSTKRPDFFVNVLGCKEAMLFGPFADEKGNFMTQLVNVNPRANSWLRKLAKTAVAFSQPPSAPSLTDRYLKMGVFCRC